ncbi:uncharacterized protein LOC129618706 [Condylostylus longicornis]|uniref:uncharacterized protein LOC129618706 n=1 Tax=Condylostylus longicornis TaxID=2530218 RepID=UPI00244DE45A|nr:uncharacterized protein LOC129618706 [Condylostylus longicornis]
MAEKRDRRRSTIFSTQNIRENINGTTPQNSMKTNATSENLNDSIFNISEKDNLNMKMLGMVANNNSTHPVYINESCNNKLATRILSNTLIDHLFTNNLNEQITLSHVYINLFDHNVIIIEIDKNNVIITCVDDIGSDRWVDKELINAVECKNYWFSKFKHDKNNIHLERNFKFYRNLVTKLRREKKKKYFETVFNECSNNPAETWNCNNMIIYNKDKEDKAVDFLYGLSNTEAESKINELNMHFATIGEKFAAKIESNIYYEASRTNKLFNFEIVNEYEINRAIISLNKFKAIDIHNMSYNMLKSSQKYICEQLTIITKKSLVEGIVPKDVKTGRIVPVFKTGVKSVLDNYRPICITPVLSKVIEKIVHNQLSAYLEKHNLLFVKQYDFKKKSCTETAIVDLISKVQSLKDNRKIVSLVFIDLNKAFDMVNHNILLKKLYGFGANGKEFNWFESYLKNRSQFIKIDNLESGRVK